MSENREEKIDGAFDKMLFKLRQHFLEKENPALKATEYDAKSFSEALARRRKQVNKT